MARPVYKLEEGSVQWQFQQSRAKIRIMAGGFANGKTTAGVILTLKIARDYPGANILLARSTYPKLNDTLRKEFLKWCPNKWIARKNLSQDNVVELQNGTVVNFRYVAQHGKQEESTTSNLLSATYDFILIDQVEDPEITEKDFNDLLGRLRGNTIYEGDDATMPTSGPRWIALLCNPTRNWVYKKLVKPRQDYDKGIMNPDLLVDPDGKPLIEIFEGSTYTNKANLEPDYIETLEAAYKGQMRTRFLLGEWGAFEGLVYPQYDAGVHMLSREEVDDYYTQLLIDGFAPSIIEAYDHGIAVPACYGLGFADHFGNAFVSRGFHEKEKTVDQLIAMIERERKKLLDLSGVVVEFPPVLADPSIFRRTSGNSRTVGTTVARMFHDKGIAVTRANNDIVGGVAKVQSYLSIDKFHRHPISETMGSPRLFFCNELSFIDNEIVDYYWKKDSAGEYEDTPTDRRDHAMDMIKYFMTHRPRLAQLVPIKPIIPPRYRSWQELEKMNRYSRSHRHAA